PDLLLDLGLAGVRADAEVLPTKIVAPARAGNEGLSENQRAPVARARVIKAKVRCHAEGGQLLLECRGVRQLQAAQREMRALEGKVGIAENLVLKCRARWLHDRFRGHSREQQGRQAGSERLSLNHLGSFSIWSQEQGTSSPRAGHAWRPTGTSMKADQP